MTDSLAAIISLRFQHLSNSSFLLLSHPRLLQDVVNAASEDLVRLSRPASPSIAPTSQEGSQQLFTQPPTQPPAPVVEEEQPTDDSTSKASDPYAFPLELATPPTSTEPDDPPQQPADPHAAPNASTPFSQLIHLNLIRLLSTLHERMNRALEPLGSTVKENGSTFVSAFLLPQLDAEIPPTHIPEHPFPHEPNANATDPELHGTLYVTSTGDSAVLLIPTPSTLPPSKLFRRLSPDIDPAFSPCSYEDSVYSHPRLKEGQWAVTTQRDVALLNAMRDRHGLERRGHNANGGWGAVYSPKSGWGLGMCSTLGNRNHEGFLIERTNVYAWPMSSLLRPFGNPMSLVITSDGIKDGGLPLLVVFLTRR
jgi:hypothetical protein